MAAGVSGQSGDDIGLVAHSIQGTGVLVKGLGDAEGGLNLASSGNANSLIVGVESTIPAINTTLEWLEDAAPTVPGDWECRFLLTSGTTPNAGNTGLNTWVRLNSSRNISNTRSNSAGTTTSTLTVEFREFGGSGSILATVTGMVISAVLA